MSKSLKTEFDRLPARDMSDINDACDVFSSALENDEKFSAGELLQKHFHDFKSTGSDDRLLFEQELFKQLLLTELEFVKKSELPLTKSAYVTPFHQFETEIESVFSSFLDVTLDASEPESPGQASEYPAQIGSYEIMGVLGRGGMGVVYKARQKQLNRIVALKTIRSGELASREQVVRFEAESKAVAKFQHPGIVQVFEVGEHDGIHFFSMAYVEGQTLADLVSDEPITGEKAAKLLASIGEAIEYAHANAVLHRDLKPANVLLDTAGNPQVTDFGLAKRTDVDSELTETGQLLGTPAYMSPEQVMGNNASIGARSDVYALGGILYCLLTGRPPFQTANKVDLLLAVVNQDPVPPRQLNPSVDRDLETICLKCLRKDPAGRYASAADLSRDLNRYLANEPIAARPISTSERARKFIGRNPVVSALTAFVVASLVALLVGGTVYQNRLSSALAIANAERESAAKSEAAKTELLYSSLTDQAKFLNQTRPVGYGEIVWDVLKKARNLETPSFDLPELRQIAVSALGHASFEKPFAVEGLNALVACGEVTPQRDQIMIGLASGEIVVLDAATKKEIQRLTQHDDAVTGLRFQDNKTLVSSAPFCREIHRWKRDVAKWKHVSEIKLSPAPGEQFLKLSQDGRAAIGWEDFHGKPPGGQSGWTEDLPYGYKLPTDSNATFFLRELDNQDESQKLELLATKTFATGGKYFAASYSSVSGGTLFDNSIHVYDLAKNEKILEFESPVEARSLVIDCLGTRMAVGGHSGAVVYEIPSGKLLSKLTKLHCEVTGFVDGAAFVATSEREKNALYSATDASVSLEASNGKSGFRGWHFSENFRFAFESGRDLSVTETSPKECVKWTVDGQAASDVSFSPDGQTLICSAGDRVIELHDVESGNLIRKIEAERGVFHPSGKLVAVNTGELELRTVDDNRVVCALPNSMSFNRIRFSQDGTLLSGCGWHKGIFKVYRFDHGVREDMTDSKLVELLEDPNGFRSAYWSAHSNKLASVAIGPDKKKCIQIRDFAGGEKGAGLVEKPEDWFLECERVTGNFCSVVFTDDRHVCVLVTNEEGEYRLQRWDRRTSKMVQESPEVLLHPICASPDGKLLVCRQKIVDAETLEVISTLPSFSADPWGVDWSPNGKKIAFGYVGGDVVVWDLEAIGLRLNEIDLGWSKTPNQKLP